MSHLQGYPADLPIPVDDGACNHLVGLEFPADVLLQATTPASDADEPAELLPTTRTRISVAQLSYQGLVIVFFYPRTAPPEEDVPPEWNAIPGARGCTPQNCSFRDSYDDLLSLGLPPGHLFGCSTQSPNVHKELSSRLHLQYTLLSDQDYAVVKALRLPTFDWKGTKLVKRLTIAVERGRIVKVWYPIFPPDSNVKRVVEWLESKRRL